MITGEKGEKQVERIVPYLKKRKIKRMAKTYWGQKGHNRERERGKKVKGAGHYYIRRRERGGRISSCQHLQKLSMGRKKRIKGKGRDGSLSLLALQWGGGGKKGLLRKVNDFPCRIREIINRGENRKKKNGLDNQDN